MITPQPPALKDAKPKMATPKNPRAKRNNSPAPEAIDPTTTEVNDTPVTEATTAPATEAIALSFDPIVIEQRAPRATKTPTTTWVLRDRAADTAPDIHKVLGLTTLPSSAKAFPNDYLENAPRIDKANNMKITFVRHANRGMTFYVEVIDTEPTDAPNAAPYFKHTSYDASEMTRGYLYTLTVRVLCALVGIARKVNESAPTRYAIAINYGAVRTQNPHDPDVKYAPLVVPYASRLADLCAVVAMVTSPNDPKAMYATLAGAVNLPSTDNLVISTEAPSTTTTAADIV